MGRKDQRQVQASIICRYLRGHCNNDMNKDIQNVNEKALSVMIHLDKWQTYFHELYHYYFNHSHT